MKAHEMKSQGWVALQEKLKKRKEKKRKEKKRKEKKKAKMKDPQIVFFSFTYTII